MPGGAGGRYGASGGRDENLVHIPIVKGTRERNGVIPERYERVDDVDRRVRTTAGTAHQLVNPQPELVQERVRRWGRWGRT